MFLHRHTFRIPLLSAALLAIVATTALGGQHIYFRDNEPTSTQSPSSDVYDADTNPGGWRDITGGNTSPQVVPGHGSIYFGFNNNEDLLEKKTVVLKLRWIAGNKRKFSNPTALGFKNGGSVKGYVSSVSSKTSIKASWKICPAWEYIAIKNRTNQPQDITISVSVSGSSVAPSYCAEPKRDSSGFDGPTLDTFSVTDAHPSIPAELTDPIQITEVQVFPIHVDTNEAVPPTFAAEPFTGNWTPQFVNIDHLGNPRPHTGVSFTTDGPGLTEFDPFDLTATMIGQADTLYALYLFDAVSGDWFDYEIDLRELPWFDSFDNHDDTDLIHGLRDWQGWDNDPAFDAPVTNTIAQSPPNSLNVADETDIVRPFEGADSGAWSFTAWQYIPSDFASGSAGNFAGSYFNILNTYNDNGPYDWSVQIQIDSNDGMLKVFHGQGTDRISVPFETDRWVKIQTVIDLENDWTQVYYDDDLVTEYSWTGGVLGGDTGVPEIKAVDLFAQGSSSIFYDDLVLEPIAPPCRADLTGEGDLDFFDIAEFLALFSANEPRADWNNDNTWDFFDVLAYLDAFAAGCP
jgi:hypothetical protein